MRYTHAQIQAALDAVQGIRATTSNATEELGANGLGPELAAYAHENAVANVSRWQNGGVALDEAAAFAAGWLDGLLVGLALARQT